MEGTLGRLQESLRRPALSMSPSSVSLSLPHGPELTLTVAYFSHRFFLIICYPSPKKPCLALNLCLLPQPVWIAHGDLGTLFLVSSQAFYLLLLSHLPKVRCSVARAPNSYHGGLDLGPGSNVLGQHRNGWHFCIAYLRGTTFIHPFIHSTREK